MASILSPILLIVSQHYQVMDFQHVANGFLMAKIPERKGDCNHLSFRQSYRIICCLNSMFCSGHKNERTSKYVRLRRDKKFTTVNMNIELQESIKLNPEKIETD